MTTRMTITFLVAAMSLALTADEAVSAASTDAQKPFDRAAFEKRLEGASNEQAHEIVRAAFQRGDVEALLACNNLPETQVYFFDEFSHSKDVELKAHLAERMLRDDTLWKPDPPLDNVRSRIAIAQVPTMGVIHEIILQRLGNIVSVEDLLADPQLRVRVADQLRASLTGSGAQAFSERPQTEEVQARQTSTALPQPSSAVTNNFAAAASPLVSPVSKADAAHRSPIWLVAAGLAVLVTVTGISWSRRSKR